MADDDEVADIVEAMQRELSPELVTALSDLPITEVPRALEAEPELSIEPYDPANPDNPEGTDLDCATAETANGRAADSGNGADGAGNGSSDSRTKPLGWLRRLWLRLRHRQQGGHS